MIDLSDLEVPIKVDDEFIYIGDYKVYFDTDIWDSNLINCIVFNKLNGERAFNSLEEAVEYIIEALQKT